MKAVTALRMAPYSIIAFLGFGALGFLLSWLQSPLAGWSWLLCLVGFFFYGFCRIGGAVLRSREFARGYTTIKAFAGEYRYIKNTSKLGSDDLAGEGTRSSSIDTKMPVRSVETPHPESPALLSARLKYRRVAIGTIVLLVLAWIALIVVRFWMIKAGENSALALDYVLFLGAGFVLLYGGIAATQIYIASRGYRRVRARDAGQLFLSLRSPEMIRAAIASNQSTIIRTYIVIGFDESGIRVWNIAGRRSKSPAYKIAWSDVIRLADADEQSERSHSGVAVVVSIDGRELAIPFRICNPYIPIVPSGGVYRARVISQLSSAYASSPA